MAELVDALHSGCSGGNPVEVRVLFWAHYIASRSLFINDLGAFLLEWVKVGVKVCGSGYNWKS